MRAKLIKGQRGMSVKSVVSVKVCSWVYLRMLLCCCDAWMYRLRPLLTKVKCCSRIITRILIFMKMYQCLRENILIGLRNTTTQIFVPKTFLHNPNILPRTYLSTLIPHPPSHIASMSCKTMLLLYII